MDTSAIMIAMLIINSILSKISDAMDTLQFLVLTLVSLFKITIGPLIGAFFGVGLGFWVNNRHNRKLREERKLFFRNLLMHEAKRSIKLIKGNVNLIPVDAWNAIVNSGDITLFENKAIELSDIYFQIQNYNYEAKIIREAYEFSDLSMIDPETGETISRGSFLKKNLDEKTIPQLLEKLTELEKWIRPLAGTVSTSVRVGGNLKVTGADGKEK